MNDLEQYGRALAARSPIDARTGFRADLRGRLLAQVGPTAEARRRPRPGFRWLRPVVTALGALALVVGTAGTVAGASLPGEPGFALKRAAEELFLAVAPDDATRAERLVAQSEARLAELRRATSGSAVAAAAATEYAGAVERLVAIVERLRGASTDGRGESALALAEAAARSHLAVLEGVRAIVPDEAQDALRRAIDAERRIGVPAERPGERDATPPQRTSAPGTGAPTAAPGRTPPSGPTRPAGAPPARTPGAPAGTRTSAPAPSRP